MRPLDTSEEAWQYLNEKLRQITPEQKIRRVAELTVLTHRLALEELRRRFPHDSERRLRVRLLARTVDASTIPASVRAALDWPEEEG
jgi:hypothetical protein